MVLAIITGMRRGRMRRYLALLLAVALGLLIAGCQLDTTAGGGTDSGTTDTAPAAAPTHWVKVATFSGTSDRQTTAFRLRGGEQKLVWKLRGVSGAPPNMVGAAMGIAGVHSDQIGDAVEANGFRGSALAHAEGGQFYLQMVCGNVASWRVTIYERRPQ
jgi:hypothetical protein